MSSIWFTEACAGKLRAGSSDAVAWMQSAPGLLIELCAAHNIEVGIPLQGGGTGAVCSGLLDGQSVVCKLVLKRSAVSREAQSLRWLASSDRVPAIVAVDDPCQQRHMAVQTSQV